MRAAQAGDRAAFGKLALLLEPRGRAFARALVGSDEDAMDLTQECLLRMWKARAEWVEERGVLPWFHGILRNLCISLLRSRERVRAKQALRPDQLDEDDVDWEYVDDELQPPAHLAADEGARAFWRALGRLSTRDREILALRHFEELSYARLAERLRIPEGTVMSRLFHARRRLRAALPPELAEELRR
jgi:RNA polymerase sigma-70 factor (ECF subfamily)